MDNAKIGALIRRLRKEKKMTQLQLALKLHISDKTVSKWERGLGCPDVSLIGQLSGIFEAAQSAADIYLENVRKQTADADLIRENARQDAERITAEAAQKAAQMTEVAKALLEDAQIKAEEKLLHAQTTLDEAEKKSARMMEETTAVCMEKEKSVNAYIASIQASFHSQFQNLDQLSQRRAAQSEL